VAFQWLTRPGQVSPAQWLLGPLTPVNNETGQAGAVGHGNGPSSLAIPHQPSACRPDNWDNAQRVLAGSDFADKCPVRRGFPL